MFDFILFMFFSCYKVVPFFNASNMIKTPIDKIVVIVIIFAIVVKFKVFILFVFKWLVIFVTQIYNAFLDKQHKKRKTLQKY